MQEKFRVVGESKQGNLVTKFHVRESLLSQASPMIFS